MTSTTTGRRTDGGSEVKKTDPLQPYAIHFAGIVALSDENLEALRTACKAATQTNCWWAQYQVAQYMLPVINGEISRRRKAATKNYFKETP